MAAKPSQLSAGLVARKGQATPAVILPGRGGGPPVKPGDPERTAITVKLDDERYRRLKNLGARRPRRSGQAIMVAALDAYLDAQGA